MKKLNAMLLVTFLAIISLSYADDGDQNRRQNPVIDDDGNIVGLVTPNVDCVAVPSPDQSGVVVYFCTEQED